MAGIVLQSPAGFLNKHDWRRIIEIFVQFIGSALLIGLIRLVPTLHFQNPQTATLIVFFLSEVAKRVIQGGAAQEIPPATPAA